MSLKRDKADRGKEEAAIVELKRALREKATEVTILQQRVAELIKAKIASQSAKAEYEKLQNKYEELWLKFSDQRNELEYLRQINVKLKSENEQLAKELEQKSILFTKFVEETKAERSKVDATLKGIKVKKAKAKIEEAISAETVMKVDVDEYLNKLKWIAADSVFFIACIEQILRDYGIDITNSQRQRKCSVSYTHLTLPTICSV
eukprot:TRINITY_DN5579_c0_g2_i1.p1 TRINITY_DN5579_c0_g2~~TRINITY_DN5579_c0_g2_i1.p1  ORF type:complete len:205 (+),score=46.79 TRINITY_DN5579_c0_g2_i1:589-1203(+)